MLETLGPGARFLVTSRVAAVLSTVARMRVLGSIVRVIGGEGVKVLLMDRSVPLMRAVYSRVVCLGSVGKVWPLVFVGFLVEWSTRAVMELFRAVSPGAVPVRTPRAPWFGVATGGATGAVMGPISLVVI